MITCLRLYNDQVALFREAQRHQTVGAWRSGSAPALGAGGRKFEPCRPDHNESPRRLTLLMNFVSWLEGNTIRLGVARYFNTGRQALLLEKGGLK